MRTSCIPTARERHVSPTRCSNAISAGARPGTGTPCSNLPTWPRNDLLASSLRRHFGSPCCKALEQRAPSTFGIDTSAHFRCAGHHTLEVTVLEIYARHSAFDRGEANLDL